MNPFGLPILFEEVVFTKDTVRSETKGRIIMDRMSKEELLRLVKIIANAGLDEETGRKYNEREIDRLVEVFEENIPHPGGSDLIFYPELCGLSNNASIEEIVEVALSYKPINL